jgi:nucleotide-binding universal stress UspA family protein
VPFHTRILSGPPVRTLHEWILKEGVDQVVMTTHGRGGLERLWLGSVADGLVRHVPAPVLLWRPGREAVDLTERPSFQRILVPLDGSELAEAIVFWARELARLFAVPVSLVAVFPVPDAPGAEPVGEMEVENRLKELEAYLDAAAGRAREGGIQVDTAVRAGASVADEILSHRKRIGADLVALSTHGRGGITRLLLGSVADKVIRGSEGHVLVHLDSEEQ